MVARSREVITMSGNEDVVTRQWLSLWNICDACGVSDVGGFRLGWRVWYFCPYCGALLRRAELPLKPTHWIKALVKLALVLYLVQLAAAGVELEIVTGRPRLGGTFVLAALSVAAAMVVFTWRRTRAESGVSRKPQKAPG
jgi:hypothetical protein